MPSVVFDDLPIMTVNKT